MLEKRSQIIKFGLVFGIVTCIIWMNVIYMIAFKKLLTLNISMIASNLLKYQIINNIGYIVLFISIGIIMIITNRVLTKRFRNYDVRLLIIGISIVFFIVFWFILSLFKVQGVGITYWMKIGPISITTFDVYLFFGLLFVPFILREIIISNFSYLKKIMLVAGWIISTSLPGVLLCNSFLLPILYCFSVIVLYLLLETDNKKVFIVPIAGIIIFSEYIYIELFVAQNFLDYAIQRLFPNWNNASGIMVLRKLKEEIIQDINDGSMILDNFKGSEEQLGRNYPLLFVKELLGEVPLFFLVFFSCAIIVLLIVYIFRYVEEKRICYAMTVLMVASWFFSVLGENYITVITTRKVPFFVDNGFIWIAVIISILSYASRKNHMGTRLDE